MSDNSNVFGTDLQSIQVAYAGFAKGDQEFLLLLFYGKVWERQGRVTE